MSEQSEVTYLDGDIVWVKLGSCWWPGEVVGPEKLPPDLLSAFRKPPIAVVKFFQEDTYEYVKNLNSIFKYNCSRKEEFINKGLDMYRKKHGPMEKFPEDVIRAETAVGGDIKILTRDEFQETKKESYAGLFGDPKKTPASIKKGKLRSPDTPKLTTPMKKIKDKTNYKVHILLQGSKTPNQSQVPESVSTPSTSRAGSEPSDTAENPENKTNEIQKPEVPSTPSTPSTPTMASPGQYACHACPFTTHRLNVLILHNKSHSLSYIPYTPMPVKKKPVQIKTPKTTPVTSKTPKPRKPRPDKPEKEERKKKSQSQKRVAETESTSENKKPKTDEEIKSSLLADWDDGDEESNDESATVIRSPEALVASESPSDPTLAELPTAQIPDDTETSGKKSEDTTPKKTTTTTENPESSSDSKYEFREDEDWPVEADIGRKIPRIKSRSKRKSDTKSLSIDDEEIAREVAELLNKTTVPELPSAPEPLKVEENFPEPSIVKSPDKNAIKTHGQSSPEKTKINDIPPTKTIFKTKTFFRSRHSRSQDAIGKYVAEQLNAVERIDMAESELNGVDLAPSPEIRVSPPVEQVKVARLAPKIQLKKMKAEAQLREREKSKEDAFLNIYNTKLGTINVCDKTKEIENSVTILKNEIGQDFVNDKINEIVDTKRIGIPIPDIIEKVNNDNFITKIDLMKSDNIENVMEVREDNLETEKDLPKPCHIEKEMEVENDTFETVIKHNEKEKIKAKMETNANSVSDLKLEKTNNCAIQLKENDRKKSYEPFMNESTASAVDALLSVSREADRVTKVISDDPPEDLFEEDIKDDSSLNGLNEHVSYEDNNDQKVLPDIECGIVKSCDEIDFKITNEGKEILPDDGQESNNVSESNNCQDTNITTNIDVVMKNSIEEVVSNTLPPKNNIEADVSPVVERNNDKQPVLDINVTHPEHVTKDINPKLIAKEILSERFTKDLPLEFMAKNMQSEHLTKEYHSELMKKDMHPERLVKDIHSELIAKDMQSEHFTKYMKTELMSKDIQPQIVSKDVQPELMLKDVQPELISKNLQPDLITKDMQPKVITKDMQPEVISKDMQPTLIAKDNIHPELDTNAMMPELVANDNNKCYPIDNVPSESDLQIAEALMNLPTTTLQKKSSLNHHENNSLVVSSEQTKVHTNDNSFQDIKAASSEGLKIFASENSFQDISTQNVDDEVRSSTNTSLQIDIHPSNNDTINSRFETEQEKSENLNAAKSLVQMSETIEHKIKIPENDQPNKELLSFLKRKDDDLNLSSQVITKPITEVITKVTSETVHKTTTAATNESKQNTTVHSSKLLKILEEPCIPKVSPLKKSITKQVIVPGKEKILNFDVGKPILKPKSQSPKQKIIIRRTASNKTLLNNITEVTTPDKIILSRTSKSAQDGSPVQTYTIQTTPEPPPTSEGNTIIIQQKIKSKPITKTMSKLQKIKPAISTSPIKVVAENKKVSDKNKDEAMFDINSMPVVLSDDILTPESIEKMAIVMSDGNVISNTNNPPKLIKTKAIVETDKVGISAVSTKSEIKTLLMNSTNEISKITTPNILSKSSKLRGAKPMLVIDKVTGKQKIIMTKPETPVKDIKQPQSLIQSTPQSSPKAEKFIILPTQSSPRPGKTQKIVIDPQTGKAHVLVEKGAESSLTVSDNKPVSAKLIPSAPDASASGGSTVMIITNAQGAQSRIVLTPEHEKILFPNKQQNVSQLKTVTHRVTAGASAIQKTAVTSPNPIKTQTRIVPKQKSAIITSKGQLIVGGRIATTTQNIAPLPEIRPATKRILPVEPKKLVQSVQKNSSERLIFLQQKSGAVMQLTAAQFEHLQRTGQIIQKPPQEKVKIQKSISMSPTETLVSAAPKQRARKQTSLSPTPPKKVKHEIAISPAPATVTPMPALKPLSNTISSPAVHVPLTPSSAPITNYADLDNIEELLPSTAIAKQEPRPPQPEVAAAQPPPAALSDGQLLAVPGEHFGGPSGSFYLCVEENGSFTVIDNRPLVLENNQLVPMAEPLPALAQPERRDILEAALANSDVFHADTARDDAPDFRDLNANVSVHCRVSETSTTLNQPIMTPVEVPSKADSEPTMPSTIEDGLAVIGVTPLTVPTSLELPITVTDPRIAPKTTDPLSNNNYGTALLPSPNTEMTFATSEQMEVSVVGPISMPILTDEDPVGKSMPILTDDMNERTISSVESTIGSPSSIDVRESENEDGQWPRRLLTPCSDTSETSAEIPLQPVMQLSANDLSSHNS